jgi:hypothetical protein
MGTQRMIVWLWVCVLLMAVQPHSVLAAKIVSATMCEKVTQPGMQAEGVKDRFGSNTPEIHILISLQEIKAASRLKSSWICVDGIEIPNYEIDTAEAEFQKDGEGTAHFSLSRPQKGWPLGQYKVDLYLDGNRVLSVPFSIVASPSP